MVNIVPVVLRCVDLDELAVSDSDRNWGGGPFHEVAPLSIHFESGEKSPEVLVCERIVEGPVKSVESDLAKDGGIDKGQKAAPSNGIPLRRGEAIRARNISYIFGARRAPTSVVPAVASTSADLLDRFAM